MAITVLGIVEKDLNLIVRLSGALNAPGVCLFRVARNFEEVTQYLDGVGVYANRDVYPFPTMLLLDCENPGTTDLKVLEWVRESENFKTLPIGILTANPAGSGVICQMDDCTLLVPNDEPARIISLLFRYALEQKLF